MLPFFVPTLNHVGQISLTRWRFCYEHCRYITMCAYSCPLGAAWLNCCAPVTGATAVGWPLIVAGEP